MNKTFSEGNTGEYQPLPVPAVPRPGGRGTAGLRLVEGLDHHDEIAGVREGQMGWMHSWELVTAVDGPGTRMTVFLNGCPLRCQYCHNPDTMATRQGSLVNLDELVERLRRYRRVFSATGGGLTISGGEPLMQPAFVSRLLSEARGLGIHTALDTSGFLGSRLNSKMMDDLDLVLLDVKSGDPDTYRKVTGQELEPTIKFGQRLADEGKEIWIRYVLVPGLTDDPDNIAAAADQIAKWSTVSRVEVLPFHQMGRDKWDDLGMVYQLEDTSPPTSKMLESARDQFRKLGLKTF